MLENNVQNFSLVNSSERHLLHLDYLEMSPPGWGLEMVLSRGKSPLSNVPMRTAVSSLLQTQTIPGKRKFN